MKRVTSVFVLIVFVAVSTAGNDMVFLCVPLVYDTVKVEIVCDTAAGGCGNDRRNNEPSQTDECDPESQKPRFVFMLYGSQCESMKNCCKCKFIFYDLGAVIAEHRYKLVDSPPEIIMVFDIYLSGYNNEAPSFISRPRGIHATISSTVIRC